MKLGKQLRKIEEMEKLGKLETVTVSSSAIPEQIVDEETIAPLFRRRRSLSGVAQRVNGVVQQAKLARGYFGIFLHWTILEEDCPSYIECVK